jgi:hypothetical protein
MADVTKEALLAQVNELKEKCADQARKLALAQQALADQEKGLATLRLRNALDELATCFRQFSGPLLGGDLSREDRHRFRMALFHLQLEFRVSTGTDGLTVAHLVRDEGVAGSNPATPTNEIKHLCRRGHSRSVCWRMKWRIKLDQLS